MRYRPASNAPGTKRPSANVPEDEERRECDGVRAGVGVGPWGVTGAATVCVTVGDAPPFIEGRAEPQDRQKRLDSGTSFVHVWQVIERQS